MTGTSKDTGLTQVLGELRAVARRRYRGLIHLDIVIRDGRVMGWRVEDLDLVDEDYDRLMRQPPWGGGSR